VCLQSWRPQRMSALLWRKPTPCSPASAPTATSASPVPPPRPSATSAACPAASISSAASACTTSGRRRRPRHHSGRALDRAATRTPRLRWRKRSTRAPSRRHPARLSRRHFAALSALDSRRTQSAPPCPAYLGAGKTPMPRIYNLSGRVLWRYWIQQTLLPEGWLDSRIRLDSTHGCPQAGMVKPPLPAIGICEACNSQFTWSGNSRLGLFVAEPTACS
jgi:hypothetical protein